MSETVIDEARLPEYVWSAGAAPDSPHKAELNTCTIQETRSISLKTIGLSGVPGPASVRLPGSATVIEPLAPIEPTVSLVKTPAFVRYYEPNSANQHQTFLAYDGIEKKRPKAQKIGLWLGSMAVGASLAAAGGIDLASYVSSGDVNIAGIQMSSHLARQNFSQAGLGLAGRAVTPKHGKVLSADIGVNAKVEDASNINIYDPLEQQNLVQLGKHPQPAIEKLANAAERDFLYTAAAGAIITLGLELAFLKSRLADIEAYGGDKSNNLDRVQRERNARSRRRVIAVALVGAVSTYGLAIHTLAHTTAQDVPSGGELQGLVASIIPTFEEGSNDKYVAKLETNLSAKLAAIKDQLPEGDEWTRIGFEDDYENNDTMASFGGDLAKLLKVQALINGGDLATYEDLFIGMYTVDSQTEAAKGIVQYLIEGQHETKKGENYAVGAGMKLAPDKTVLVGDTPVLMLSDVWQTDLNEGKSGKHLRDPDVTEQVSITNAVNEIRKNKPKIVFAHDYRYQVELAKALITAEGIGALPLLVGGRSYNGIPTDKPDNTLFDGTSTATIRLGGYDKTATVLAVGSAGGHQDTSVQFDAQNTAYHNVFFINNITNEVKRLAVNVKLNGDIATKLTVLRAPDVVQEPQGQAIRIKPSQIATPGISPDKPLTPRAHATTLR